MQLPDGTLLQGEKYRIVRFIKSGGFGCTYEAEHVMLQMHVAIKEFFVDTYCERDETTAHVTVSTSKRALVERLRGKFLEEARAISSMRQPHIVRVIDIFEENGTAYYVMDYIDGLSLHDMVKQRGALPEDEAVKYIRHVAGALKYVHGKNRLHLDVKPSNIMIDNYGNAILIDFGTSKQYDEVGGENTTTLMGKTPGYAPIEQMSNSVVKFTPATDIYALGATLYKLLTGVTPLDSTLLASGETLAPLPSNISRDIAEAIYSAMKINKTQRTQDIDTFLRTLNGDDGKTQLGIPEPLPEPRPTPISPKPTPPPPSGGKGGGKGGKISFKTICIVLCFAVATVVIGSWWISRPPKVTKTSTTTTTAAPQPTAEKDVPAAVTDAEMTYNGTTFTYTGPVNTEGNAEGIGTGVYASGIYNGNYVNGCREGKATFTREDGKFEGTFKNNEYDEGTFTFSEQDWYFIGTFKDMLPYNGKWYAKDGTFIEDVKDGE